MGRTHVGLKPISPLSSFSHISFLFFLSFSFFFFPPSLSTTQLKWLSPYHSLATRATPQASRGAEMGRPLVPRLDGGERT